MDTNIDKKRVFLPQEIKDFISSLEVSQEIGKIAAKNNIDEKGSELAKTVKQIIYKEKPVSELQNLLKENLQIQDEAIIKEISLDIANLLLQIRHYLQGVEDLIRSLGGEVPETKPITPVPPEMSQDEVKTEEALAPAISASPPPAPPTTKEDIKTLIIKNPQIGSQEIGTQDIFTGEDGAKIPPTISNWLQDYDYFLGAGWHSNLDRIRYLGQNENTQKLDEKEKVILVKILESYDDDKTLPFSLTPAGLLDFGSYSEKTRETDSLKTSSPPPPPLLSTKPPIKPPDTQEEPPPPPSSPPLSREPKPLIVPEKPPLSSSVPKENIINLKEKPNGTIPDPSIY